MRMLHLTDLTRRTHYISCNCYAIGPTTKLNASYTRKSFPFNPGYILNLDFMRKLKVFMTRISTSLPGDHCLHGWYVNRMDSCTPTGQDCMFRTFVYCDRENCTNYTTHRLRDIMVLLDCWQQRPERFGGLTCSGQYNTMYASMLLANVTRQRDTSPMDSFNRTRYLPCPSGTYRLTS
jgi:hypothetical protein